MYALGGEAQSNLKFLAAIIKKKVVSFDFFHTILPLLPFPAVLVSSEMYI
jgi:hypothetical protein